MRMLLWLLMVMYTSVCFSEKMPDPESIGQVIWSKGQVTAVLPAKEKRALKRHSVIYHLDTVETDKSSTAQIGLTDGTLLAISEQSVIRFNAYRYDKTTSENNNYVMDLVKGGFRTVTGEIADKAPKNYQVKTPVSTLGVQGTDYSLVFKNNKLYIAIQKGKLIITNASGTYTMGTKDGRYAVITSENSPLEILKTEPEEIKEIDALKLEKINVQEPVGMPSTPTGQKQGGTIGGSFCILPQ